MATILITGGTGFAGSHLVEALLQKHPQHTIHVTSSSNKPGFVGDLLPSENIHHLDLTDAAATTALLRTLQPTTIYHLAAYAVVGASFEQAQQVLDINSRLQLSVLEGVKTACPTARVLVIGSGMEYDVFEANADKPLTETHPLGPVSPYAVSKVTQDLLSLSYHYSYQLNVVRARPFNHIGERQTPDFAIPSFAKQIVAIERGQQTEIKVGNLEAIRDFLDVKDVVQAYIVLMEHGQSGQVYNIGSGHGYKMLDVLTWLCQQATVPVKVTADPNKFRPLDVPYIVADITKLKTLGWQPHIELGSTLERILRYWREQPLS